MIIKNKVSLLLAAAFGLSIAYGSTFTATAENLNGISVGADNYRVLETGMPGVIISPVKSQNAGNPNGQAGALYTANRIDNTDISYTFNRPVMTNTAKIYLIWYGNWSDPGNSTDTTPRTNDYKSFVTKYLTDLSSAPRWILNQNYYFATNSNTKTSVTSFIIQDQKFVNGSIGSPQTPLTQSDILSIAKSAYPTSDSNGIYFVITSSDISVSGFGTSFCGWHSYDSTGARKYSFVGDPISVSGCKAQNASPNNAGADAMLSVLTHELEETVTDPALNAWYSNNGNENSDKCAWSWGTTGVATNGSAYNLTLGGKQYLIQQNFKINPTQRKLTSTGVIHKGNCAMS